MSDLILYSRELEEDLLGGLMICTPFFCDPEFTPVLTVDDFHLWQHKVVFTTMLELKERGIEPNETEVKKELARTGKLERVGGREFIGHLIYCANTRPTPPGFVRPRGFDPTFTAPLVRSLKLRRDGIAEAEALAKAAMDFSKPFQGKQ